MKYLLILLIIGCTKPCPDLCYEFITYNSKWVEQKRERVMFFDNVCDFRKWTELKADTVCDQFKICKWKIYDTQRP